MLAEMGLSLYPIMSVNKKIKRNYFHDSQFFTKTLLISLFPISFYSITGCSTTQSKHSQEVAASPPPLDIQKLIDRLSQKIETLEATLSRTNDKLEATRLSIEKQEINQKPKQTPVIAHPSSQFGAPIEATNSAKDPEAGFTNDTAIQTFRKSIVLFQGQKYSEAILAFSSFLEKYPDHTLAGSAQFYIGESYLKQKEYNLAVQELQHVLKSYDRSPHIADTLKDLIIAKEALKDSREASKYRQTLESLFAQSPAMKHKEIDPSPPSQASESSSGSGLDSVPLDSLPEIKKIQPLSHPTESTEESLQDK